MRSLHPNHVWQTDSTTGAYYYLPGGRLRWMPEDQFYKNKVANIVQGQHRPAHALRAWPTTPATRSKSATTWAARRPRTCWISHLGHVEAGREPHARRAAILVMDPGAANKGQLLRNFCTRVGVELICTTRPVRRG